MNANGKNDKYAIIKIIKCGAAMQLCILLS
jgi:hypothetical protein